MAHAISAVEAGLVDKLDLVRPPGYITKTNVTFVQGLHARGEHSVSYVLVTSRLGSTRAGGTPRRAHW
jgi:hypothetical protein